MKLKLQIIGAMVVYVAGLKNTLAAKVGNFANGNTNPIVIPELQGLYWVIHLHNCCHGGHNPPCQLSSSEET